jgi:hypothetical protein
VSLVIFLEEKNDYFIQFTEDELYEKIVAAASHTLLEPGDAVQWLGASLTGSLVFALIAVENGRVASTASGGPRRLLSCRWCCSSPAARVRVASRGVL